MLSIKSKQWMLQHGEYELCSWCSEADSLPQILECPKCGDEGIIKIRCWIVEGDHVTVNNGVIEPVLFGDPKIIGRVMKVLTGGKAIVLLKSNNQTVEMRWK